MELSCNAQQKYDTFIDLINKCLKDYGIKQLLINSVDDLVTVLLHEKKK